MKIERGRVFLFEPARFKNDPAVLGMTLEARGAYSILFCEAWDMPEPGVLPDNDVTLATLARCTVDDWIEVRAEVAQAFDTTSRPGFWVQRGLVATHEEQNSWFDNKIEAGRKGGVESGKVRRSRASRRASSTGRSKNEPVCSGVVCNGSEEKKDSVPLTELSAEPPGSPNGLAAGSFANAPGNPHTDHPDARAQIEALERAGLVKRQP